VWRDGDEDLDVPLGLQLRRKKAKKREFREAKRNRELATKEEKTKRESDKRNSF
jgi:hypothetical protein